MLDTLDFVAAIIEAYLAVMLDVLLEVIAGMLDDDVPAGMLDARLDIVPAGMLEVSLDSVPACMLDVRLGIPAGMLDV